MAPIFVVIGEIFVLVIILAVVGLFAYGVVTDSGGAERLGITGRGFCDTHDCISTSDEGRGSIVQCADGEWSHSARIQGASSYHGGVR